MRKVGVVTVARSDYGIYLPLLHKVCSRSELQLHLIVSGMHLAPEFGLTVRMIEKDGFKIGDRVEMLLASDTPEAIAKSMGLGVMGFAQSFARCCPDILVVLGDRFEMHAAALAALPFKIPIAHIHGGELTEGAIDDALRHSITKLSHLHFVSTEVYKQRVIQLGEEPWRVTTCGALSLDNLNNIQLRTLSELEAKYNFSLEPRPLLVTFHPVTLEHKQTEWQINELLTALNECAIPVVFTLPNADTSGRIIIELIRRYVQSHSQAWMADNLGTQDYFSMMKFAAAMVGNSSSGIIEAASFGLPVVNIGNRQRGRVRGSNVIDVDYSHESILEAVQKAVDSDFRAGLKNLANPYGSGDSAEMIVECLSNVEINDKLLIKQFHDLKDVLNH